MVMTSLSFVMSSATASSLITLRHRRGRRTHPPDLDPDRLEVHPAHAHHVAVEPHQEADLLGGTLPVFGGEGVEAEPFDTEFDCTANDVDYHRLARLVAVGAGQPLLGGPAAIAVHHDGHMIGQSGGLDSGRSRLGDVLRWPARPPVG